MRSLGIHSFVWTGGTTQDDLESAMARSAELGYKLVEFPRLDPTKFDVDWLSRRLIEHGLSVVVTMGLPPDCDVSSEDAACLKRGEAMLDDAVRVTRDLGGTKLGGIIFSAHTKYATMPTRQGWDNSVEILTRVADRAKQSGVTLNLEVVNRFESNVLNTAAQGLEFIRQSDSDNIFLHLDTFHMNIEEADPSDAIRAAGAAGKLGYFHIGESYRGYLGTGTIDFAAIFSALHRAGYEDWITFESFSNAVVDRDLSITCGIWRDTWRNNQEVARRAKAFIEAGLAEAQMRAEILERGEITEPGAHSGAE